MSTSAPHKTLSRIAAHRLQKELSEWQLNPPVGFNYKVSDNLDRWIIEVTGAPGTLYANEQYQLQVDFPEHYPMEAPQVIFIQTAPLHPHIYSNGHICLDILYDSWSPAMTVSSICISILSMLSSSSVKERGDAMHGPLKVLDRMQRRLHNRLLRDYLIAWHGQPLSDATWETVHGLHAQYPDFAIEDDAIWGGKGCYMQDHLIMIGMCEPVVMEDPQRKPGGGFMMTKYDSVGLHVGFNEYLW